MRFPITIALSLHGCALLSTPTDVDAVSPPERRPSEAIDKHAPEYTLEHFGYYEAVPGLEVSLPLPAEGPVLSRLVVRPKNLSPLEGTYTLTLENMSTHPLTVLRPGDGSENAMRTPSLTWILDGTPVHPYRECGNINPLKTSDIMLLPRGGRLSFSGPLPRFTLPPGAHALQMLYELAPGMMWTGIRLGSDDPRAAALLKAATPVETITPAVQLSAVSR